MNKNESRRNRIKQAAGHYSSLWVPGDSSIVPTTLTTQRKSYARRIENAKKKELLLQIEAFTGKPAQAYGRSYDSINRRWTGVKTHGSD